MISHRFAQQHVINQEDIDSFNRQLNITGKPREHPSDMASVIPLLSALHKTPSGCAPIRTTGKLEFWGIKMNQKRYGRRFPSLEGQETLTTCNNIVCENTLIFRTSANRPQNEDRIRGVCWWLPLLHYITYEWGRNFFPCLNCYTETTRDYLLEIFKRHCTGNGRS